MVVVVVDALDVVGLEDVVVDALVVEVSLVIDVDVDVDVDVVEAELVLVDELLVVVPPGDPPSWW